jgi:hypothetical protein
MEDLYTATRETHTGFACKWSEKDVQAATMPCPQRPPALAGSRFLPNALFFICDLPSDVATFLRFELVHTGRRHEGLKDLDARLSAQIGAVWGKRLLMLQMCQCVDGLRTA